MPSLNKVMLIGNLTRDPEVRYTPKGSAVADLSLATNRSYTADNGEKREEVTYVDVVLWARLAEIAGQYLHKGAPAFIEGRLQLDTWEDKATGQKRSRLRVVGETLQLLGGRRDDTGAGERPERPSSTTSATAGSRTARTGGFSRPAAAAPRGDEGHDAPLTDGMEDDDIPF
jgi:single-strand DNA-binding protein